MHKNTEQNFRTTYIYIVLYVLAYIEYSILTTTTTIYTGKKMCSMWMVIKKERYAWYNGVRVFEWQPTGIKIHLAPTDFGICIMPYADKLFCVPAMVCFARLEREREREPYRGRLHPRLLLLRLLLLLPLHAHCFIVHVHLVNRNEHIFFSFASPNL